MASLPPARCSLPQAQASRSQASIAPRRFVQDSTSASLNTFLSERQSTADTRPRPCNATTAYPGVKRIDYLSAFDEEGGDYYEILGVDPESDKKSIKKAYYNAMRDCHPDSNEGEEAIEFATFLNDIYETLMDEEARADYDSLIGFSSKAINPFMDEMQDRDQIFVDEITCIGCTNCAGVCPRTFEMQWEEHGRARAVSQGIDTDDDVQDAIDSCPVNCIHKVSSAQLTLLETVMRKMERVDVWLLNSGGGHSLNPFSEAALVWNKRQALRRARQVAENRAAIWAMWEPAGGSKAGKKPGEQGQNPMSKQRAKSAQTAKNAARAARRWRDYQRKKQSKAMLQLPGN